MVDASRPDKQRGWLEKSVASRQDRFILRKEILQHVYMLMGMF